ncbi:hypothetical protein D3C80_1597670 [compost metagenome]
MLELASHRLRVARQLGQVARHQYSEDCRRKHADGFADQWADTEVLVRKTPGEAETGETHYGAEQIDRQILDRSGTGRFRLDLFERGNEQGGHGNRPLAEIGVGVIFCHACFGGNMRVAMFSASHSTVADKSCESHF